MHRPVIMLAIGVILTCVSVVPAGADDGIIKEHTEVITSGSHTFEIEVGGTVDPENLEIRIENLGDLSVINPRITANGKYNWYTLEDMVAEITSGCTTEKEKAMAIFSFVVNNTYWWTYPKDKTSLNPVRYFNIYGYHICSMAAGQVVSLCRAAGLDARVWELWGHTVAEAHWNGAWHHLDPSAGIWYLKDDNRTIASVADLQEHPEWVARTFVPSKQYFTPDGNRKMYYKPPSDPAGKKLVNIYASGENNYIETGYDKWLYTEQSMDLSLRPCEKLVRWWKPVLRKHYDQQNTFEPPRYANGRLIFEPDFKRHTYDGGIERRNIRFCAEDGNYPLVHVDRPQDQANNQFSTLAITMKSPYVMVGGYVDSRYYKGGTSSRDRVSLSADLDPTYRPDPFERQSTLWNYYSWAYGSGDCRAVLDEKMLKDGAHATYGFKLYYDISADRANQTEPAVFPLIHGGQSGLDYIGITADLQINPNSLPALKLGRNVIRYTDQTEKTHRVQVTYRWREDHNRQVPEAPRQAVSPRDGAKINSLAPGFEWTPAEKSNADTSACYRFQLSLRPDCAWPLASNFNRDVSRSTVFQAPKGWLNHKTTYYWRVRTENASGVTGPWSKIFSFTTE